MCQMERRETTINRTKNNETEQQKLHHTQFYSFGLFQFGWNMHKTASKDKHYTENIFTSWFVVSFSGI